MFLSLDAFHPDLKLFLFPLFVVSPVYDHLSNLTVFFMFMEIFITERALIIRHQPLFNALCVENMLAE